VDSSILNLKAVFVVLYVDYEDVALSNSMLSLEFDRYREIQ